MPPTLFFFFCFSYLFGRVLHFVQGWPQTTILLLIPHMYLGLQMCTSTPSLLDGWNGVLLTFCPGWLQTMILLLSTSQVARITGMHHYAWSNKQNSLSEWLLFARNLKVQWRLLAKKLAKKKYELTHSLHSHRDKSFPLVILPTCPALDTKVIIPMLFQSILGAWNVFPSTKFWYLFIFKIQQKCCLLKNLSSKVKVQLALHIHEFNQPDSENIQRNHCIWTEHMQMFFLLLFPHQYSANNYSQSISIALGTSSNQRSFRVCEMCTGHMQLLRPSHTGLEHPQDSVS
jgi:hypothetical protein